LAFLSLRRPYGENVANHPRKPHGDGQAIVELQELQLILVRPIVFGLALAMVLAGHHLNSLVRNSGIRRERFFLRYQQNGRLPKA
jgi:hypothetical protein